MAASHELTNDEFAALSGILETLGEGLAVFDGDGRLLLANRIWLELVGFDAVEAVRGARPEELEQRFELTDAQGAPFPHERIPTRLALAGEVPAPVEVQHRLVATGKVRWSLLSARPVFDEQGRVRRVVTVMRDLTEQKRDTWALHYLAEASALLAGSLDYDLTLQAITDLAVPRLASSCSVELLGEDGALHLVASVHRDPIKLEVGRELRRRYPIPATAPFGVAKVVRTGQPDFIPKRIPPDQLERSSVDAEHLRLRRALDTTSIIIVPLTARGRTFGAMALTTSGGDRRLSHADLKVAQELANRAAVALDNARLFTQARAAEENARRLSGEQAARAEAEAARRWITAMLDSITEPFIALDREWRFRYVNQSAEQLVDKKREVMLGKDVRELFQAPAAISVLQCAERALRTGEVVMVEEFIAIPQRWYEFHIYPFEEGLAIYLRDITERRRALELQERLGRFATLRAEVSTALSGAEALPAALRRCCQAYVDHVGAAAAQLWMPDAEQADVLVLRASAGPATRGDTGARISLDHPLIGRIAAERQQCHTGELPDDIWTDDPGWARREGLVELCGYPLPMGSQQVGVLALFSTHRLTTHAVGAMATFAELIAHGLQRRRTEETLAMRAEELARSNAELERFAYVASHDLQEPLRMVASYIQLLARRYRGRIDADADDFIGFAVDGVVRMQRLISDLLTYSRVGSNRKEPVPVSSAAVLEGVLTTLQQAVAESGAQVTWDALPVVMSDELQLRQLLQNLVGNALKFRGQAAPQIHVSAHPRGAEWLFSVRDNGIGIEPQYSQRIFDLFQRLHGKDEYEGTGIGLAICKKIVEQLSGRIWVESALGQGSTFFFTLPGQAG